MRTPPYPEIYYDLHIHSCLSPCADDDMTVNNIIRMSMLNGLNLVALTDHNTAKNCPAFLKAAVRLGQNALPGMELCTAEEVHIVCLFPNLPLAMGFDRYVESRLPKIPNKKEIFGRQLLLDEQDRITGELPNLLITATTISIDEVPALVRRFRGIAFPAHADRDSYSILSMLGFILPQWGFRAVELIQPTAFLQSKRADRVQGLHILQNSDAHNLWSIKDQDDGPPLYMEAPSFASLNHYLNPK